jgi:hypothetical protein
MTPHPFKLVFVRDDTTGTGFACHEGGAFEFDQAISLIVSGKARIADDEPERATLQAAVKAYKQPKQTGRWETPMVGAKWPGWHSN